MPNTLLTTDKLLLEVLARIENKSQALRLVNRQYDGSFAREGAKIGATARVRNPVRFEGYDLAGSEDITDEIENINETYETIQINRNIGVAYEENYWDKTLTIEKFIEKNNYEQGVIEVLTRRIDRFILDTIYKGIFNRVGTPGTPMASHANLQTVKKRMNKMAIPEPFHMVIDENTEATLVPGLGSLFHPQDRISKNYIQGQLADGQVGFKKIVRDTNIRPHTVGAATGYKVNGANQGADGTLTIDTGSGQFKQGDVINIANVYAVKPGTHDSTGELMDFVVTADSAASPTSVSIAPALIWATDSPWQNVNSAPANNANITYSGTPTASTAYPINLAFNPNVCTFVTVDGVLPHSQEEAGRKKVNNLSISMITGFDILKKKNITRFDIMCGCSVLNRGFGVGIWG